MTLRPGGRPTAGGPGPTLARLFHRQVAGRLVLWLAGLAALALGARLTQITSQTVSMSSVPRGSTLGWLLGLAALPPLTLVLPLALFAALCHVLASMRERGALLSLAMLGVGPGAWLRLTLGWGAAMAALVLYLSFQVEPWARYRLKRDLAASATDALGRAVGPVVLDLDGWVVSGVGTGSRLEQALVLDPQRRAAWVSQTASATPTTDPSLVRVALGAGETRIRGDRGRQARIVFSALDLDLPLPTATRTGRDAWELPLEDLLARKDTLARRGRSAPDLDHALHRRVSTSLACLALAAAAVPAALVGRRAGPWRAVVAATGLALGWYVVGRLGDALALRPGASELQVVLASWAPLAWIGILALLGWVALRHPGAGPR